MLERSPGCSAENSSRDRSMFSTAAHAVAVQAMRWNDRNVGRFGVISLTLLIAAGPYILFFDPVDYWPWRAARGP